MSTSCSAPSLVLITRRCTYQSVSVYAHLFYEHIYLTTFCFIDGRIPAETTPGAVVKSILRQLLEKRIGNVPLFQILDDAYQRSKLVTNDEDYNNILWNALECAVRAVLPGAKQLVIVVDGVDETSSGEASLVQKLYAATGKSSNVKLITLGAQAPPAAAGVTHIRMSEDLISDDIVAVVRSNFGQSQVFQSMPEMDRESLAERIAVVANGSFLWAKLVTKVVRHESSPEALRKAVDSVLNAKPTINDLVLRHLQSTDVTVEAKVMLLWLATANRPLQLKELASLAAVHVEKQTVSDSNIDPLQVLKPVNSLVFLQDGHMYLRHGLIRTAVLDVFTAGKLVTGTKDHNADFVTRLFIYIKTTVTDQREPSLTSLDLHDAHYLLNKHPLLDFSVRYWPQHFKKTTVFVKNGEADASKTFSNVFPASITPLLLQSTVWDSAPTPETLSYQATVTNVCRHILGPNNIVTLQSTILLALLYRRVDRIPEAIPLFHQAAIVSRTLLTTRHIVTMQMASTFLELTTDKVTESKTDIMTWRETVLLLLVECYKVHYGNASENVLTILNQLAEHYRLIKDQKKMQDTLTLVQSITASHDSQADTGKLNVKLTGSDQIRVTENNTLLSLDVKEHDEEISVSYDIDASIEFAKKFAADGKFELAEHTYVEIWRRVCEQYRTNYSAVWEERMIKSVVAYSKFLQSQKRQSEASAILSSFWQENERSTLTESSASYFQEVASLMKTVGLSTMALAIYKHCSEYYQSIGYTQTSTYKEIQQSIQTTSKEVIQSISSSSHAMSETTTLEEVILETSHSIATVDKASFMSTDKLVGLYISQHRLKDAIRLIKQVLHGIWPSFFAQSLQDVTLPTKHTENCVELAERLGQCYHSRNRLTKEQDVLWRIYRAVRSGKNVEDELRHRITTELLTLLERTDQTDRIIDIHQDLLNDYTKHHGAENQVVIKTLWTLARLTRPRPIFVDYYQQIIRSFNKNSPTCHPEAFEPLAIVATELWNQGRYSDALRHYEVLFNTFLEQPKLNPKLQDPTFVQEVFSRYTHCLRTVRTDFAVLHKVTVEYQSKCKTVFGMQVSITVQATLTLAKLCQESKRYETEAIALYEELLKTKSEELDLQEISATLDAIYEEQAAVASSTDKNDSISSAQVERAVRVLRKRITSVRETYGWAHEESLSKTKEIVSLHAKHGEMKAVTQELQQTTIQVLSSSETSNLSAAASMIASSYIATGQTQKATELSEEIYRQIFMKDTSNTKTVNFDLTSKGRQSLVFLAQLEHSLRRQTSSVTEILASLTTEYVYFEEFRSLIKTKTSTLHSVSVSSSRLYQLLITTNRQAVAARVFDEFMNYFLATDGKRTKLTDSAQVKIFLLTILEHFSTHRSQDFIRSIGIMSNQHVVAHMKAGKYDTACDLALASFKYISAHDVYRTPAIVKFVFALSMSVSGSNITAANKKTLSDAIHKKLLGVSATILHDVLGVINDLKINLAMLEIGHLNSLIGLLGEQQDYTTLAWLLTMLWDSRKVQHTWQPYVAFALGRRFIMARYLVGDFMAALRLAENIVYNYRRVYGPRHTNTLEMSVLLSQLYIGIAQRYQADKNTQELAHRYYRKSATLHENILRVFCDPSLAELDGVIDGGMSMDGSHYELDMGKNGKDAAALSEGEYVRRHMHLLKLSVERLGAWPKDYSEYERLNADLFGEFSTELKGVEGVEKWNLKAFGSGKAESTEDQLDLEFKDWRLFDEQSRAEVEAEEEEL